jgi:hypothetical protein
MYSVWGLIPDEPTGPDRAEAGRRASDVLFAKSVVGGEIGERYFELCRLPAPGHVATQIGVDGTVDERIKLIDATPELRLLEQPVFKRTFREGFRPVDVEEQASLWLLGRAEAIVRQKGEALPLKQILGELMQQTLVATIVDELLPRKARTLPDLFRGTAVPFLWAQRFAHAAHSKYMLWCDVWSLQRREDAGESVGEIPVPPKYAQKDYRDATYWRLRGKLDVPKERFIAYPGCESDEDGEPVYGWAGWDHLQRAVALAELYMSRKTEEGWTKDRLQPMLAGIIELLPWLEQWHNEPSVEHGGARPSQQFADFLAAECAEHGFTRDDLRSWRPPEKVRRKRAKKWNRG